MSPSYTRDYPLVAKRGEARWSRMWTAMCFWISPRASRCVSTGHCHPKVVAAIQQQAGGTDSHVRNGFLLSERGAKLAEKLASIAPGKEAKRVYFGNSGAEAVEAAIKLARYHTRRDKVIAFYGCVSRADDGRAFADGEQGSAAQGIWRLARRRDSHAVSRHLSRIARQWIPRRSAADCLAYLENEIFKRRLILKKWRRFSSSRFRARVATCRRRWNFCRGCRQICRKHGIMLVADEVQSGMGRTGKWWACGSRGDRAGHHLHGEGNCVGNAAERDDRARERDGLEAGRACVDVWRQSGVHRGVAGDDRVAGARIHGKRADALGEYIFEADREMVAETSRTSAMCAGAG